MKIKEKKIKEMDLRNWLAPYQVEPSKHQVEMVSEYLNLLILWNRRMPLTSLQDTREIVEILFGESLAAITMLGIQNGRLADVGSGAGFPGLALKMFLPNLEVTLIEPNLKKSIFLEEIIRRMGLARAKVVQSRLEEINANTDSYDWIVSRALAEREGILRFGAKALKLGGRVGLWVGESDARSLQDGKEWQWEVVGTLPGTKSRMIISGKPIIL
jgi:16S rRNA (guanine527-N7)-methyltransferase